MSYSYRQTVEPPRRRRSWLMTCLTTLVVIVFLLLAAGFGALYYLRPRLSEGAGGLLADQLKQQIDRKLDEQFGSVGGQIPADFSGTVVVPEADVNQYIAANPQELAPLSNVQVRFLPGEMQASVSAYGLSGTAHAGLAVSEGRVVIVSPSIDGPLSFVLDPQQLAESLQSRLNDQLDQSGKHVTAIDIQQGQILATVEGN